MLAGQRVIDVHHHFLPKQVFDQLKSQARGAPRLVNDKISITLNEDIYNVEAHLRDMDVGQVDAAILTNSGVSILGLDTCRKLNDGYAEIQRQAKGRLYGTAHVDIQDPDSAPRELERGIQELGLVAVALPASEPGVTLDSKALGPMWRKICELDVPVILHPALLPQNASTDYGLERSCFRPFDTTLAAVRIMCGVFPEFPKLKFVLPHLGGTSVFLRGRIAMVFEPVGWQDPSKQKGLSRVASEQRAAGLDEIFSELWGKFYFDTAGTGAWRLAVQWTAEEVTPARMLFGSDYPLEAQSGETVRELVEMVAGLRLRRDELQAIAGRNAEQLFRL